MRIRSSPKRVITHRHNPQGVAVCDGCGIVVPYYDLVEQKDFRGGNTPVGVGIRVCSMCYDTPNEQLKLQVFKPDPVPLRYPRPDLGVNFSLLTQDSPQLVTEDDFSYIQN